MIGLKKRVMALVVAFALSFSLVQNIGASLFTIADATDGDVAEFSEMEGTKMPFNTFANETDAVTEEYEELQGWTFDSDVSGWKKGGYWTNDATGVVTGGDVTWNDKGLLGLTENFTACTGTWNQTSIKVSITKGQFAEAAKVTFDYYTTAAPSRLIMVFAGSVEGTYTKEDGTTSENNPWANAQQTYMFTDVATETESAVEIGSVTYTKYSVTLTVDDNALAYGYEDLTSAQVRKYASSFTLGEIRTDNAYAGSVFFDNVSVMKKKTVTAGVTLSADLAVYNTAITAEPAGIGEGVQASYAWYVCTNAAGANAAPIAEAQAKEFTPDIEHIGGWIYCTVTVGEEQLTSNKVRVAASDQSKAIELPVSETKIGNYDLALLNNTTDTYGKIEKTKWAAGGYIRVEYSGITETAPAGLPTLNLGTWSSSRTSQNVQADRYGTTDDGTVWAEYSYESMVEAWYGDADFGDLKALRIQYSGEDKENLTIHSAEYTGPILSYGDLGESVSLRGSYTGYQYLFTRHVGSDDFDATRLREDDRFYVEYALEDADETVNLVAQCHSAKADGTKVKSTYAVISPTEKGTTGDRCYATYTIASIKEAFGTGFRYIDGLRIATESGDRLSANASLYYFEGKGDLVDDIRPEYTDAVEVPWTLYDDTDKDGIAVIGASITQNPLVTPSAMEGKPFYSAGGSWSAMLDRTDVVTYGIGSQTTSDIAARFHEVLDYDYKQIIIQCGNNDLGAFNDATEAAEHEYKNYVTMLEMVAEKNEQLAAAGKPEITVFILALNPVSSAATNAKIPVVIEKLKTLEKEYPFVTYIEEIYDEFLDVMSTDSVHSKDSYVMSDGLHPVAEGYAIYAKYLKPLLSKASAEDDATLASLSYRMSGDFQVAEAKKVVDGFVSGKAANGNGYDVVLPVGTASDATFRLYVQASNIACGKTDVSNAAVTVDGQPLTLTDEYGNGYAQITLADGKKTVTVTVTAADGTTKQSYVVRFALDPSVPIGAIYQSSETKTMEATDESISAWSAFEYDVNYMGVINPGAKISFDIVVENAAFESMQIILNNAWGNLAGDESKLTLMKNSFSENKYHVEYTYSGTGMDNFESLQIKIGNTAYRGTISISNVLIQNG